ncbi:hypothetical protein CF319_g7128 [Tilletia indica]|nr:hypothetical protein CF319_g7128 [Tilletia indica]
MRTVHTAELVSVCAVVWTRPIVLVLVLVAATSFLLSLVAELTNSALRSFTANAFQRSSNLYYLAQDCANLGTMSVVKEQSCRLAAVNSALQLSTVRKYKYEKLEQRRDRERLNRGLSPELQGAEHWFEARSTRPRILQHLGTPLLQPVAYRPRRHGKGVGMPPGPPPNTNSPAPGPGPAPAPPSSLLSHNSSPVRPHISPHPHHRSAPAPLPNPFAPGLATGLPFWPAARAAPGPAPPRPTPTSTHARSPPPPPPPAPALPHQDIPGLIADAVGASEARMWRELYEVRDGLIRSWAAGPS